jgi:hypothetical protein
MIKNKSKVAPIYCSSPHKFIWIQTITRFFSDSLICFLFWFNPLILYLLGIRLCNLFIFAFYSVIIVSRKDSSSIGFVLYFLGNNMIENWKLRTKIKKQLKWQAFYKNPNDSQAFSTYFALGIFMKLLFGPSSIEC